VTSIEATSRKEKGKRACTLIHRAISYSLHTLLKKNNECLYSGQCWWHNTMYILGEILIFIMMRCSGFLSHQSPTIVLGQFSIFNVPFNNSQAQVFVVSMVYVENIRK